jgi:hypothetical protein
MSKLRAVRSPLFRAFTHEQYANDFVRGKFRFGELGRYRRIEDLSRQDDSEGRGHYVDSEHHQWHTELGGSIYVLSFSSPDINQDFLSDRMGAFIVRLDDPQVFTLEIERHMTSRGVRSFNGVHGHPVEYTAGRTICREMDPMQRAVLSVVQKSDTFRQECEYRFYTILNQHPQCQVAEFLNIDLGSAVPSAKVLST